MPLLVAWHRTRLPPGSLMSCGPPGALKRPIPVSAHVNRAPFCHNPSSMPAAFSRSGAGGWGSLPAPVSGVSMVLSRSSRGISPVAASSGARSSFASSVTSSAQSRARLPSWSARKPVRYREPSRRAVGRHVEAVRAAPGASPAIALAPLARSGIAVTFTVPRSRRCPRAGKPTATPKRRIDTGPWKGARVLD